MKGDERDMKLGHYSSNLIDELEAKSQENPRVMFKPRGLWFEVEGEQDWREWTNAENSGDINNQFHYRLSLAPGTKMLHIRSVGELDDFHKDFKSTDTPYPGADYEMIDWLKVADIWDGIVIAPYQWSRRLSNDPCSRWYYAWDCASGCLWNPNGSTIELLEEPRT